MRSSLVLATGLPVLCLLVTIQCVAFGTPIDPTKLSNTTGSLRIVTRKEWGARQPKNREHLEVTPAPYVVIHHGGIKKYCHSEKDCAAIARSYQDLHMDDRGWFDIGYSFLVGEDGNAYEGRGWDYVGAHAPGYNTQSIGICVMGDFSDLLPNKAALEAVKNLIEYGVSIGKISKGYKLIGHRQVRNTVCPGETFFKYVKALPHWTTSPVPRFSSVTTEAPIVPSENTVQTNGTT